MQAAHRQQRVPGAKPTTIPPNESTLQTPNPPARTQLPDPHLIALLNPHKSVAPLRTGRVSRAQHRKTVQNPPTAPCLRPKIWRNKLLHIRALCAPTPLVDENRTRLCPLSPKRQLPVAQSVIRHPSPLTLLTPIKNASREPICLPPILFQHTILATTARPATATPRTDIDTTSTHTSVAQSPASPQNPRRRRHTATPAANSRIRSDHNNEKKFPSREN